MTDATRDRRSIRTPHAHYLCDYHLSAIRYAQDLGTWQQHDVTFTPTGNDDHACSYCTNPAIVRADGCAMDCGVEHRS